jgi:hypothetical protein
LKRAFSENAAVKENVAFHLNSKKGKGYVKA